MFGSRKWKQAHNQYIHGAHSEWTLSVLEQELSYFQMGAEVTIAEPIKACSSLANAEELKHRIAVIERGECMFIDKVRKKI